MKHGSNAIQRHTHARPVAFCDFGSRGPQQSVNIQPGDIGTDWLFEDPLQRPQVPLVHDNEIHRLDSIS